MTDQDKIKNLGAIIALSVANDRPALMQLLRNSGFMISDNVSDEDLVEATVNGLRDVPAFRAEFQQWIGASATYSNGEGGFWSGFDASAVSGLVSTGLGLFGAIKTADANASAVKANANAQLAVAQANAANNQTALQIAQLQLEAAKIKPANNTALYVVLGLVGVMLIGGVVFLVTRKSS